MTLDHQELETLLILVRGRHADVCEDDRFPQAVRDRLAQLENKLLVAMQDEAYEVDEKNENDGLRPAHAFESREDGSIVIYATMPDGDGEPIRVEPHRVMTVLCTCADALVRKPSTR